MKKPHQNDEASFTENKNSFSSQNKSTLFSSKEVPHISYFENIQDKNPKEIRAAVERRQVVSGAEEEQPQAAQKRKHRCIAAEFNGGFFCFD